MCVRGRVSVRELSVNVLILFFTPSCMATNNVRRDVHRDGKSILDWFTATAAHRRLPINWFCVFL